MDNIIEGNPTKSFFIEMITRDISIKDAIIDLIDNSVDGANKLDSNDYTGRKVDITLSKDSFKVTDNCGGFSLETAKKYAFRFGRPEGAPLNNGSVGRFGIGMKRALFKMGHNFIVESKHEIENFEVNVDVEQWKTRKKIDIHNDGTSVEIDDWSFSYQFPKESRLPDNGTYIEVTNLYNEVSSLFDNDQFINGLVNDVERILNFSIEKGIDITINGYHLSRKYVQLFSDETIKPYINCGIHNGVRYKVIAGISNTGMPTISGWYVYCNNRLVVEADQTELTGWGFLGIPKWHIEDAMFRGIVFFDSDDTMKASGQGHI